MKFEGMTIRDIIEELVILCGNGLSHNKIIKLRRAIKELNKKLHKDPKAFRDAVDKNLEISIKTKKKRKPVSKKPKNSKSKTATEDIPTVKHILNG